MRLRTAWLVILLLGYTGYDSRASAQEPRPGWEVAPFGGVLAFDQDFRLSDGVSFRGLQDSPSSAVESGTWRVGGSASRDRLPQHAVFRPFESAGSSAFDVRYLTYLSELAHWLQEPWFRSSAGGGGA